MEYEINVSRNGRHLFATHHRSLQGWTQDRIKALAKEFEDSLEGVKVVITRESFTRETVAF